MPVKKRATRTKKPRKSVAGEGWKTNAAILLAKGLVAGLLGAAGSKVQQNYNYRDMNKGMDQVIANEGPAYQAINPYTGGEGYRKKRLAKR